MDSTSATLFPNALSLRISHEHARRRPLGRDGGDTRHCCTKDGFLVPSDAPGFGMEISEQWIREWDHSMHIKGNDVVL